jgi:hypothetical protein
MGDYRSFTPTSPPPMQSKGETERAFAEFAEAQRLSDNQHPTIASLKAGRYFGVPKIRALYEATFFVDLRKVGMPEE